MISVLYLIDHLRQGGSERYVSELAKKGKKIGVHPHVICFSEGGIFFEELRQSEIPLISFQLRTLYHPKTSVLLMQLIRFVRDHRIQVIHSFQPNANILGTLVGCLTRTPVIISRRSLGDFGSLGSKRLVWIQKNITNRMADRVLVNSLAVQEAAIRKEEIPSEKVTLIYNGLDTERYAPCSDKALARQSLGILPGDFVFGISSGLRPVKGVDVVIQGFSPVRRRYSNARLVIAGDGPERNRLEALVQTLGLETSVIFLGTKSHMEAVYPLFDAFVLCSHSEGFSNALLEAMGMGIPVVATRVGGNIEMIEDGKTGFLVPPGDPAALSERMSLLLQDSTLTQTMGKEGRAWVERTNALPLIHHQFSLLYQEIARV